MPIMQGQAIAIKVVDVAYNCERIVVGIVSTRIGRVSTSSILNVFIY